MKQPVSSTSPHYEPGSFNFTSRLEFEAKSNLLRSRSDTCLGKCRSQTDSLPRIHTIINPWTLPTIDFTLHGYQPKYSRLEAKTSLHSNKKRRNKEFVKIPIPKVLEKPVSKETPFVTSFRSPSAKTARIMGVKEGVHPAGPYKPLGPHAFRGDDFRPVSVWSTSQDEFESVLKFAEFRPLFMKFEHIQPYIFPDELNEWNRAIIWVYGARNSSGM